MLKSAMGFGFGWEMQIAQGCKVCPLGSSLTTMMWDPKAIFG
jgi:hypothetical protein